ncbi:ATP-dependent DNA ligase [Candidatus Pacearchaeota archaeon]|nr:ATP-dependent DNA ligase [Candidatus Pacearchaeota archaeon]
MLYSELVAVYEDLSKTPKRLEKIAILSKFISDFRGHEEFIYLFRGRVFPDYDSREFGISTQLVLKAISRATGVSSEEVVSLFKKLGDLGNVAFSIFEKSKQKSLFSKSLSVEHVFTSLRKITEIKGDGAVDKKLNIISELLINSKPIEAKYIVRTLLSDLRIGVADAVLIESINLNFFSGDKSTLEKVQRAYDLLTDYSEVLKLCENGLDAINYVKLIPGRPTNVMLAVKVLDIDEAFEVCGTPAAFEHKYDGFRTLISSDGKNVNIFTRKLENVTLQFPDIVSFVKEYVKAKKFIIDAEAVGYDSTTGNYLPFESISQRIKRKYNISELAKKIPVELNVFDVIYLDGESVVELPFKERRKILEKIIENFPKKIRIATQLITSDKKEADKFYKDALKIGEEGIMIKNLNSTYVSGRYVGTMAKLKPVTADLDLVIVGAEYGTGKRAGGLTSFIVACRDGEKFVEVGRVSSGLKEKISEGTTYSEINNLLQPLIISEDENVVRVKPKIIMSVTYQNIQPSSSYSSGFALRFPRITHYRPDKDLRDIASLEDIKLEINKMFRKLGKKKVG